MPNLLFAFNNLVLGGAMVLLVVGMAVVLRGIVAPRDGPLGAAAAVAIAVGGWAYALFLSAALGWIGAGKMWQGGVWWLPATMLWIATTGAVVIAFNLKLRRRIEIPHPSLRILPPVLLLAWILSFNLLMCFDPEFHNDALWYHLTLPLHWVDSGGLKPHPTIEMSGYPLLTELLYAVPVTHDLPFTTRIIHLAFGLGVVLVIYGFLRDRMSAAGALTFGAAFFIFDSVNQVATWSNTDLARTFFLVGAAAFVARFAASGDRRRLALGAVFAGLAMSTHYMCIVFGNGLLTIALIVISVIARRKPREIVMDLAIFWVVSLIVFSPWPIKNMIQHGWPLEGLKNTSFRIPALEAISGFYFGNVFIVGFLIVAVGVLLYRASDRSDKFLAFYLVLYAVVGAFEMPPIERFFFPILAVGLILLGRLAEPFLERRPRLDIVIPCALLVLAILVTASQWRSHLYDDAVRFVFRDGPYHELVRWHR